MPLGYTTYERKKPRVVLDKRFAFANDIKLGDKGQIDCTLEVVGMRYEPDENHNDVAIIDVKIVKAEKFDAKATRIPDA